MDASCESAVVIYGSFSGGPSAWKPICGTSLSAPLFAGIVALADQYAGRGKAYGLGVINPAIYTIAARHEPGIVGISAGDKLTARHGAGTLATDQPAADDCNL